MYVVLAEVVLPAHAGLVVFAMYVLSVVLVLAGGAVLRLTTFRGMRAEPLVLVLPPYQRPRLRATLLSVGNRVGAFATGAGKVVVAALVVVWALMAIPAPGGGSGDGPAGDSLYGWAAEAAAPVMAPAGFGDWHLVSALAGGFVAKEVVVGQLAQAYAVDPATQPGGLVSAIRETLTATSDGHPEAAGLALMVFVLGYTPCVATVAEQRRILGTRWTLAAVGAHSPPPGCWRWQRSRWAGCCGDAPDLARDVAEPRRPRGDHACIAARLGLAPDLAEAMVCAREVRSGRGDGDRRAPRRVHLVRAVAVVCRLSAGPGPRSAEHHPLTATGRPPGRASHKET